MTDRSRAVHIRKCDMQSADSEVTDPCEQEPCPVDTCLGFPLINDIKHLEVATALIQRSSKIQMLSSELLMSTDFIQVAFSSGIMYSNLNTHKMPKYHESRMNHLFLQALEEETAGSPKPNKVALKTYCTCTTLHKVLIRTLATQMVQHKVETDISLKGA